jgi:flagellar biosynthetic protein FliQ
VDWSDGIRTEDSMSEPQVLELGRDLFFTAMMLALPTLAASLIVGLFVSIFQAVTSIQEQTLSFVPRLVAVVAVILLSMPWTLQVAMYYTTRVLNQIAQVGH